MQGCNEHFFMSPLVLSPILICLTNQVEDIGDINPRLGQTVSRLEHLKFCHLYFQQTHLFQVYWVGLIIYFFLCKFLPLGLVSLILVIIKMLLIDLYIVILKSSQGSPMRLHQLLFISSHVLLPFFSIQGCFKIEQL